MTKKVQASKEAPVPTTVRELKAYLGMLNYYERFTKNLSSVLAPLYNLLQKNAECKWEKKQQEAFRAWKDFLCSADVLVHFDSSKDSILSCDASPYGIGGVLSHKMNDRTERPIGFVSRTLDSAEKNYSQLEKESLALVFSVKKFYQSLLGNHVFLQTISQTTVGIVW